MYIYVTKVLHSRENEEEFKVLEIIFSEKNWQFSANFFFPLNMEVVENCLQKIT